MAPEHLDARRVEVVPRRHASLEIAGLTVARRVLRDPVQRRPEEGQLVGEPRVRVMAKRRVLQPDADYYLCGPAPFMTAQIATLKSLGVPESRIHHELFGTGEL